jgi:hypothetical protein
MTKSRWIYLIGVVHAHGDTLSLEIIHVHDSLRTSISRAVYELELPWPWCDEVRGTVLNPHKHVYHPRSKISYLVTDYIIVRLSNSEITNRITNMHDGQSQLALSIPELAWEYDPI